MKASSVLKALFAAALFAVLLYSINPRELIATFSVLSATWVIILLLLSFILVYVSALKWKVLLGEKANQISTSRLVQLYLIGYFVNSFLPSFVAGDAIRSVYLGRTVGQKDAAVATILERASGLLIMLLLAAVAVWFADDVVPRLRLVVTGVCVGSFFAAALCCDKRVISLLPKKLPVAKLLVAREHALDLLFHPARFCEVILLSLLYHLLAVANTWACCAALGWSDVSIVQLCIVVPIILLVSSLPLTPSGLGIQEGAFYYFLKKLGATGELALGVGLLLRAKTYVLALFGGILWLLEKKRTPVA